MTKTGWMLKRGHIVRTWKWRFFLLDARERVLWYSVKEHEAAKGAFDLKEHVECVASSARPHAFALTVGRKPTFSIAADTDADRDAWIAAILGAAAGVIPPVTPAASPVRGHAPMRARISF